MTDLCPVCNTELKKAPIHHSERDVTDYSCYRCGDFALTLEAIAYIRKVLCQVIDAGLKLSHALRTMQRINEKVELTDNQISVILEQPLPRPKEQADLLIRWLAEHSDSPGAQVSLVPIEHHFSIIGTKTKQGFDLVLSHLNNAGLLKETFKELGFERGIARHKHTMALTFDGWNYYETLLKGNPTYRKAFMAMKFGDPHLDEVLENVFKPSAKQAGFDLFKLDDAPRAGLIDDRLRVEIQSSDFLIADLTHENNGAYWEAGYAEGLGKPVIYTCEKEKFEALPDFVG
ncbi:MAG: hypothetical protein HOP34_07465 [Methylococcaceae bacterium]|nr:hypothetical protein [Methylococcaceae bacterium]